MRPRRQLSAIEEGFVRVAQTRFREAVRRIGVRLPHLAPGDLAVLEEMIESVLATIGCEREEENHGD